MRAVLSESSRSYLGRPCKRGHLHGDSGFSLRHVGNGDCIECSRARIARWHASEAGRDSRKRSKAAHKEKIRADSREYRKSRRDKISAYNAEYRKSRKDWYLSYYRRYNQKRRAQMLQAIPVWADMVLIEQVFRNAELLTEKEGVRFEVDHIVPLQHPLVCGLHVHINLRPLTKSENSAKGNRWWPDMPSMSNSNNGLDERCAAWRAACKALGA